MWVLLETSDPRHIPPLVEESPTWLEQVAAGCETLPRNAGTKATHEWYATPSSSVAIVHEWPIMFGLLALSEGEIFINENAGRDRDPRPWGLRNSLVTLFFLLLPADWDTSGSVLAHCRATGQAIIFTLHTEHTPEERETVVPTVVIGGERKQRGISDCKGFGTFALLSPVTSFEDDTKPGS